MSSSNGWPNPNANLPSINVLVQYIKDMSFENPNAPHLGPLAQNPQINIQFNINARNVGTTEIEVELKIEVRAEHENKLLFSVDLLYAGVFRIANVDPELRQQFILIEAPRLLFPFARQILADVTRNGGFPPLLIDPIDFAGYYRERMAQQQRAV